MNTYTQVYPGCPCKSQMCGGSSRDVLCSFFNLCNKNLLCTVQLQIQTKLCRFARKFPSGNIIVYNKKKKIGLVADFCLSC